MRTALELYESRISAIELIEGGARIRFSHAYIHKSKGTPGMDPGTGWSQEADLLLLEAILLSPLPPLPNTIADGSLEVGGVKLALLPLPFRRRTSAVLALEFVDGSKISIAGNKPWVELFGTPIFIEDVA